MDEKERIVQIIEDTGMTPTQFAAEIDVNSSIISHIINERNKPSLDIMRKIMIRFPSINPNWLILGTGSMKTQISQPHSPSLFPDVNEKSYDTDDYDDISDEKTVEETETTQEYEKEVVEKDPIVTSQPVQAQKSISKIIVYYDDNTFEEFIRNKE